MGPICAVWLRAAGRVEWFHGLARSLQKQPRHRAERSVLEPDQPNRAAGLAQPHNDGHQLRMVAGLFAAAAQFTLQPHVLKDLGYDPFGDFGPASSGAVVAYCRGPFCGLSFEAVAQLRKLGFKARRLKDGLPRWKAAGLPIEIGYRPAERDSRAQTADHRPTMPSRGRRPSLCCGCCGQMPSVLGRNPSTFTAIGYGLIVLAGVVMLVQSLRPEGAAHGGAVALTASVGLLPCPLPISVRLRLGPELGRGGRLSQAGPKKPADHRNR